MSYDRRKFLKHSAMFTATVAASRSLVNPYIVSAANPNRPLEVLILGDSVMWGQGLNPEQKFYSLVLDWLKSVTHRDVNVTVMAHSGATILPVEDPRIGCNGEVNINWPTINTQRLDAAVKYRRQGIDPRSVDLVLVDGGINDLHASKIIDPFTRANTIKKGVEDFCYTAMKTLLLDTADTFCNARMVVTGYFPIISMQTPPDMLIRLIFAVLGVPKVGRTVLTTLFDLVRQGVGLSPNQAGPILTHTTLLSDTWYRESTFALQRAVNEVNTTLVTSPRRAGCDRISTSSNPLDRRVIYASGVFKPEHCFAAGKSSYLWNLMDTTRPVGIFASPIDRLDSEDSFFGKRAELCACPDAHKTGLERKICERAGTGHPNIAGAQEYARAIKTQLATLLPFTGWSAPHAEHFTLAAAPSVSEVAVAAASAPPASLRGIDHPFFKQAKNHPEVIAHQGGAGEWPAETLFAYQKAVAAGVDILEMDVYMTKDDELVLMHNPSVNKTTNGKGLIATKTVAELKQLDAGYRWSDDGNKTFPFRNQGITIATLKEIFEAFPNMRMNIEMKEAAKSPIARLCHLIQEHGMTERVLVASFSTQFLHAFRQACPDVATSASTGELVQYLSKNALVHESFKPDSDALQVIEKILGHQFVTKRFVDTAHRLNMAVHTWTVNAPAEMKRMIGVGVDGIITDYPTRLLTILGRPNT